MKKFTLSSDGGRGVCVREAGVLGRQRRSTGERPGQGTGWKEAPHAKAARCGDFFKSEDLLESGPFTAWFVMVLFLFLKTMEHGEDKQTKPPPRSTILLVLSSGYLESFLGGNL